ncbi:MAG: RsmB/NOP family class I SAM-dependent RNA methyltransferase [Pseudomonadota bacterium]
MTPAARLAATLDMLVEDQDSDRPADAIAAAYFRKRRYIGAKDRGAVAAAYYGTLRHKARLDWHLSLRNAAISSRNRLLAYQLLVDRRSADDIEGLFDGAQYAPDALTDDERQIVLALEGQPLDDPDMPLNVRAECPDWAAEALQASLGDRFEAEAMALVAEASLDLRVNTQRGDRDAIRDELAAIGVRSQPTPLSPVGLRVEGRPPLGQVDAFRRGAIEVQDEGSQILSLLVDARPGFQVVDFCAGAGGKSLAMAAAMAGKGRIVACDVSQGRLIRAKERIKRAGLDNIEPRLLATERDRWVKRQKGKFDRVLVDAPCSGIGAWRRNPDARWRDVDLAELTSLQDRILASAGRLTKPGGRLIYATCSLLANENQDPVARFLEETPGYRVIPVGAVWPDLFAADRPVEGDYLHLSPATTGTDGFFAAVLERKENAGDDS